MTSRTSGHFLVEPKPVDNDGFSFERVFATQCVKNERYSLPPHCDERSLFTRLAVEAFCAAAAAQDTMPMNRLLHAIAQAVQTTSPQDMSQLLDLQYVKYGQLEPKTNAPPNPVKPLGYVPDAEFEMYTVVEERRVTGTARTKTESVVYVQAPQSEGGRTYELTNNRGWPWTLQLTFIVRLASNVFDEDRNGQPAHGYCEYVTELKLAYRGKEHLYNDAQCHRDQCTRLAIGEFDYGTTQFVAWPLFKGSKSYEACVVSGAFTHSLFYQRNWPRERTSNSEQNAGVGGMQLGGDGGEDVGLQSTSELKYTFEIIDGYHCVQHAMGKNNNSGESVRWVRLANFAIVERLAPLQFKDVSGEMPYDMIVARIVLDSHADGTLYLKTDDTERNPNLSGQKHLDVELVVDVSVLRSNADLKALFKRAHSNLDAHSMTLEHFSAILGSFPDKQPTGIISKFGRQTDGLMVAGNCCYMGGTFGDLQSNHVHIAQQHFAKSILPMTMDDFPRHVLIEDKHVRYFVASTIINELMPKIFLNNNMAAFASLSSAIMHFHTGKLWGGQSGVGHGAPLLYMLSPEHNTGKTEAMLLMNALHGGWHRGLWSGDSSKPAMFERLSQQADQLLCVDDLVVKKEDKPWMSQFGRAVFDRTTRSVSGKSNALINRDDKALQSRMIVICFKQLLHDVETQASLYTTWTMFVQLFSACAPDFETLLYNGKLDRHAIHDCAEYLMQSVGKQRDRNCNLWGILLYFMLNVGAMMQWTPEHIEQIFVWMNVHVTRAVHEYTAHSSVIDQFVLATHALRTDPDGPGTRSALGPLELTIGFDKLRTDAYTMLNVSYISVRIAEVCDVIKKVTGKIFVSHDVFGALEGCDWAMKGWALFYNTTSNPWPISRCEYSEAQQQMLTFPLEEHLLTHTMLKQQRCVHFRMSKWLEIVDSLQGYNVVAGLPNYKMIVVKSANPELGAYNFYENVTSMQWYGFRVLEQCSYNYFCGALNKLEISYTGDYDPNVVRANANAGFLDVKQLYSAQQLMHFYNYEFTPHDASFPVAYKTNPFKMRDAPGDRPYADDEMLPPSGGDDDAMDGGRSPKESDDESDKENVPSFTNRGKAKMRDYVKGLSPVSALQKPVFQPLREYLDSDGEEEEEAPPVKKPKKGGSKFVLNEAELSGEDDDMEQVEPEQPGEFDEFIDDEAAEREMMEESGPPEYGVCINVLGVDVDGTEYTCGELCNPNEQLCHDCRRGRRF